MKRFHKLMCSILVVALLMSMTLTALATTRFCGECDKSTTWYNVCSGTRKGASKYYYHDISSTAVCNYYYTYYYNSERCHTCKDNFYRLSSYHQHTVTHDACDADPDMCPY